ncbi:MULTISPECIES: amidase [unclassified Clostridioides]|uniref:amidase n=1 Tax=unclassified Clostridioides TaxID=2635829 RepID=UPI001D0F52A8|nr:amidase [Clostridioides sp. ES-S-0171-01]MCC0689773.1 amidase [Clostridioides sp. ES-S-0056-01]MCC0716892.1 amidase [Clostridioides sp. ES-S-0077-01]UDN56002.1 hypothetical protein JJC02_07490 [Clostridioides sp. ES-S-0054-01]
MINLLRVVKYGKSTIKAIHNIGKSVVSVNEDAILDYVEMIEQGKKPYYMGVKDTKGIGREILIKLKKEGFIFHTIDEKSVGGRAVDTKLINPLTGRFMTGSSSATAINVLLGINDIGVGTDGGGSVLAPAISVQLYSFLAKGMGLKVNLRKNSTDGISFEAGIGFIAQSMDVLEKAVSVFKKKEISNKYEIYIIKSRLDESYIRFNVDRVEITTKIIDLYSDRETLIDNLNKLNKKNTIYISYEKNIDTYGIGDSVVGMFSDSGRILQQKANKGVIRVLNMVNANCLSIPDKELGSAFVLYSFDNNMTKNMLDLGRYIDQNISKNKVFEGYFKDNYELRKNSIVFDLE